MHHKDRITALLLIAILTLPMLSVGVPAVIAQEEERITLDKALYAMNWTGGLHFTIVASMYNLLSEHKYSLQVVRWASVWAVAEGLAPENVTMRTVETNGTGEVRIDMTLTVWPFAGEKVRQLAGTYKAYLIDLNTGETFGPVVFGVWGLTARTYNFCDNIIAIGGGMNQTYVGLDDNATGTVFLDGAVYPVSDYGTFEAVGGHFDINYNGTIGAPYNVSLVDGQFNRTSGLLPYDKYVDFNITQQLNVAVYTDLSEYMRTQTITIYAEVYKQSGVPDTDVLVWPGAIKARIYNGTSATGTFIVEINGTDTGIVKNWTVGDFPGTYYAQYKIHIDDEVSGPNDGLWAIYVNVTDPCGNNATNVNFNITVKPADLTKTHWVEPLSLVQRTDTVFYAFNITYPSGDGVDLNLTASGFYILDPDGNRVSNSTAPSYVKPVNITSGAYNWTWYVPATAKSGVYNFVIYADNLTDKVAWSRQSPQVPTPPNVGPVTDNVVPFAVNFTGIIITVWTNGYTPTQTGVYTPGQTVDIYATAMYTKGASYLTDKPYTIPSGYTYKVTVIPTAQVWVDITWANGTVTRKYMTSMSLVSGQKPTWRTQFTTDKTYPAGIYVVWGYADDKQNNTVVPGMTQFLLTGLVLSPYEGTVPPDWLVEYDAATGITSATVYTVDNEWLGTTVSVSSTEMPANTTIIIAIDPTTIPVVTKDWYKNPVNTNVTDVYTHGLKVVNVTTDTNGDFASSFVFPSAPAGVYNVLAMRQTAAGTWSNTSTGCLAWSTFTVLPGFLVAPQNVDQDGVKRMTTGNTLCEVVATGYPEDAIYPPMPHWKFPDADREAQWAQWNVTEPIAILLINGTDALMSSTLQSWAAWIAKTYKGVRPGWGVGQVMGPDIPFVPVEWRFDGTATLLQALSAEEKVKPGFVLPVLQPGLYELTLLSAEVFTQMNITHAHDTDRVERFTQTITTLESDSDTLIVYGVTRDLIDLIAALDAKVVDLQGTAVTINTTLGEVKVTADDINAKVTAINDTVVTVQTTLGAVETTLEDLGAKIDGVKGDVATVKTSIGAVEASLEDIGGKVTTINGKVATIETNLGTVAADVSALKGSVSSVQGSVATLSTTLGTVKTTVDSLATDMTSVKGTVSGLSTATYLAAGLAAVAAIAAIVAVIQITRKVYMPTK